MTEKEFKMKQNAALEQMKQMNSRAKEPEAPIRQNQPNNNQKNPPKAGGFLGGLNIPFLDALGKEADITLILGLLLILLSEKADKKLIFALIYILI